MAQDLSTARFVDGHPEPGELAAFARGDKLTLDQTQAIETHLNECAACRHTVRDVGPDPFMQALLQSGRDRHDASDRRLVEGYQLIERLGEGGAGIVYRARQPALDRDVALKLLKSGIAASDVEMKRWRRECRALAALDHPHIVKIYDAGEQAGTPFLAMELVEGKTLAHRLLAGPLAAKDAASLVGQLAAAIEFAHQHGVIHRDLKPGNVLIQSPKAGTESPSSASKLADGPDTAAHASWGDPKIADFGLSRWIHEEGQSQTGDALGTPSYMAPEQARGQQDEIGPRTDVYGLGAILYECLTGRPPFRGASVVETMQLVISREPLSISRLRSQVPTDLEAICLHCLEKEPARRYATAGALREDLTAFLQGRPVVAKRPGPLRLTWLWVRRNRWLATFVAFLAMSLTLGIAALLWHQKTLFDERALAHRHYSEARATIWQMLNTAQSHSSFEIPKLNEMSLKQAEQALVLFERLAAEERSSQPQLELARVRVTLGTLATSLGQVERGAKQLQLAVNMFQRLLSAEPDSRSLKSELITALIKLAVTRDGGGKNDEAVELLTQAQPICEALVSADERDLASLDRMAWLHHALANARWKQNQLQDARDEYQQSIKWRERALRIDPESKQIRTAIAESRLNLAQCSLQLGDVTASREQFRSAIAVLDEALAQGSEFGLLTSRAVAYLNLSNADAAIDGAATAMESCDQGIRSARAAYEVEPSNVFVRDTLFRLLGNRGMYRMQAGQAAAGVLDWREAIQLATDTPSREYCQTMLIRCLTLDHQFAAAEQEAMSCGEMITSLENRFRLAAAWGKLCEAARDDDAKFAARCAERSVAATRGLISSGSAAEVAQYQSLIESYEDFNAVRELTSAEERSTWFAKSRAAAND